MPELLTLTLFTLGKKMVLKRRAILFPMPTPRSEIAEFPFWKPRGTVIIAASATNVLILSTVIITLLPRCTIFVTLIRVNQAKLVDEQKYIKLKLTTSQFSHWYR